MKIHNVAQGSAEWFALRAGIPTASCFNQILTPAKLELSKTAVEYRNLLLAEYVLGRPIDKGFQSERMEAGNLYEQEAMDQYRFKHDPVFGMKLSTVGFVTHDSGMVGCSPDRLVGTDGLAEGKVNSPAIHMGYLLNPDSLRQKYRCQTQGQLWVCTDRQWVDTVSFCKEMDSLVVVRSEREKEFQDKFTDAIWKFIADLQEQRTYLSVNHAHLFVRPAPNSDSEANPWGISAEEADAMVEQIWANRKTDAATEEPKA